MKSIKIIDTNPSVTQNSRVDKYWQNRGVRLLFDKLVPNYNPNLLPSPSENMAYDAEKMYSLGGIGFGNWVTINDRVNFIDSLIVSFHDMDKVLKFKNNIGIHQNLKISFGARGQSRALAHYEPQNNHINLTRYSRKSKKEYGVDKAFLISGGIGSLAHEYGHFLDYMAGGRIFQNKIIYSLSGGSIVDRGAINSLVGANNNKARLLTDKLLDTIIWLPRTKDKNIKLAEAIKSGVFTPYYQRIVKHSLRRGNPYLILRAEIWARSFEQYIEYKLAEKGIKNFFLTADSYNKFEYLDDELLQKVVPIFDQILVEIRKQL